MSGASRLPGSRNRRIHAAEVVLLRGRAYDAVMNIEEFLKLHGITDAVWQHWLNCKSASLPEQESVVPDPASDRLYLREHEAPSAEFLRAQELASQFRTLLHSMLGQGRWRVTGRTGAAVTRQELEKADWENALVDFDDDRIGGYNLIIIEERSAETIEDRMRNFIETVCSAAVPKQSLTKVLIEDLAARLLPDVYQKKPFLRAWDEAEIAPGWKKAGPPRQSESD